MVGGDLHAGSNENRRCSQEDVLKQGLVMAITKMFNMAHSTIYRLWECTECMCATGMIILLNLFHGKISRRAPYYLTEFIQEGVKNVPLRKRHMQQNLAMLMGVSKTTVHCWIVASTICVHCNSLKPILTEENKWARLEMSLPFIDCKDPTEYQDMRERTHLDEKWFFSCGRRRDTSFFLKREIQTVAQNTNLISQR